MARARNIKPGFFESEDPARVSLGARILWIAMWTLADRDGWLEDRPVMFRKYAFGYDPFPVEQISDWVSELVTSGLIARHEIEGAFYLEIPNFGRHQKPHPKEPPSTIKIMHEAKAVKLHGSPVMHGPLAVERYDPAVKLHGSTPMHEALAVEKSGNTPMHGPLAVKLHGSPAMEGGSAALNVDSGMLNVDSGMGNAVLPPAPAPLSPHSAIGDWVERIRHAHPKGSSEGAVALWFADQRKRLGEDAAFDAFAARVMRAHVAWCAYWEQDGNRFAKKLEDWLSTGEWEKQPPRAVSGGKGYAPMLPGIKQAPCGRCGGLGTIFTGDLMGEHSLAEIDALTRPCPECAQ